MPLQTGDSQDSGSDEGLNAAIDMNDLGSGSSEEMDVGEENEATIMPSILGNLKEQSIQENNLVFESTQNDHKLEAAFESPKAQNIPRTSIIKQLEEDTIQEQKVSKIDQKFQELEVTPIIQEAPQEIDFSIRR